VSRAPEQYGQAACADRDSAPVHSGAVIRLPCGLVTCTGAFQYRQRHLDGIARALFQLHLYQLVITAFLDPDSWSIAG